MTVELHVVWHFKIGLGDAGDPDDETKSPKEIGRYTSVEMARDAIERLRARPGFRDWPDGFRILPDVLDRTGWIDGFTAADEGRTYWRPPRADPP